MKTVQTPRRIYLLQYLSTQVDQKFALGHYGTAANYRSTYLSIKTFTHGRDLPMSKVTVQWVNAYAAFLFSRGLVRNTVSFYMRVLRAVYNRALIERPFRTCGSPFREVYTGVDKTVKRSIRLRDIAKISTLPDDCPTRQDTTPTRPDARHAHTFPTSTKPCPKPTARAAGRRRMRSLTRDLFLFSFYSRGMTFVDMANLSWSNVRDGRITYVRRKTGQRIDLKIEPCMRELMERYRSSRSEFIFPILRSSDPLARCHQYRSCLCRYNAELKSIGRSIGLHAPLTSYCSRHTWATACRDAGISVSAISSALGHTSEATTQIYLSSMNVNVLDRANNRLLGRLKKMTGASL